MGKDLKGKELGKGITQESTGLYSARFVDRFGKRKHKRFKKLQECRAWIADATYVDEHSDISMPSDMLVDQWFDYWIGIKKKTVRSNTVRNYTERYIKNIKPVIGKMTLSDVKPLHCQKIFYDMADQEYRTSTIYQARIALYNMFEYAKENEEYSKQLDLDYVDKNYISKKKIEDTIEELKGKLKDISKRREKSKTKEEKTILWCLEIRTDERIKTLQELL